MAALIKEPTSWLSAVSAGWKFPVSQEWILARETYDLIAQANFKKPKPHPAPWPDQNKNRLGSGKHQSRNEVLRKLELMNPKESNG